MTLALFQQDAYLAETPAKVVSVNERGGIILDQTVFYPTGGGQPGDSGVIVFNDTPVTIATTIKDNDTGDIVHVADQGQMLPQPGDEVIARIDWPRRYLHMRMHTALHLLCAVVPCGVTGGQIGDNKSRLDFDVGDNQLDKAEISQQLNQLITEDHSVTTLWITDEELLQNPELVRTMSVQPPSGAGKVRLLKIGDRVDLQPCGGTHVRHTAEIGPMTIGKIENKGKHNRRVNILFA